MKFIIQTNQGVVNTTEELNLINELKSGESKLVHSYILSDTSLRDDVQDIADYIPVGSIGFLEDHLKKYHNVEKMTPIEVPKELRTYEFLRRKYFIINCLDELPDSGYWFIKKVDRLKEFTSLGVPSIYKDSLPEGKYTVSEFVDIVSEYRVMVSNTVIVGVQHYDGEPLIFPDVNVLQSMVKAYSESKERPLAYSLDVAVTEGGATVVLEVHPFASLGTYGFSGERLMKMYAWGYEYYKKTNKRESNNK